MNEPGPSQVLFPLPVGPLITASVLCPLLAGLGWLLIGWLLFEPRTGTTGIMSGGLVAGIALVVDLLIRPWKKRTAMSWMTLWILHSAMKLAGTLGLLILLYFALSPDAATLLFSYLLCFLVGLAGETWIWTRQVRCLGSPEPASMERSRR